MASVKRLHERANAADLDGVMAEVHEHVTLMLPGMAMVKGKAAFRTTYGSFLDAVTFTISEEALEASPSGRDVTATWITTGSQVIKANNTTVPVKNNALAVFRADKDGKLKFWRVFFASATP